MQTLRTRATAAILSALALAIMAAAARAASQRRAEYLEAEAAFYECIESGLDRAECLTVFN